MVQADAGLKTMGRSGYDMTGFYNSDSSSLKNKLTQPKGNSPGPARPPPSASSTRSQSSVSSSPRLGVKVTPPIPPPNPVTVQRTTATVERTHATAKKSHRFNPLGRPNSNSSAQHPSHPPPPMANRPSASSTPPQQLPPPPAPEPGSFWNPFPRPPIRPLSALPRHLGGSPPAPPPPHVQQQLAALTMHTRTPPTSVPRNRWEFRSTPRPADQQSPHTGSFAKSSSTGTSSLGLRGGGGPHFAAPASAPRPSGNSSTPRGRAASTPGPSSGTSTTRQHTIPVRNPSPGTASRLPSYSYDWCTNPACLHVRVVDTRKGKEKGKPMTGEVRYRPVGPKVKGVEVCPDCEPGTLLRLQTSQCQLNPKQGLSGSLRDDCPGWETGTFLCPWERRFHYRITGNGGGP
ncbi:hypothetical protein B0T20DRAFT_397110 [Sordaria brevicollis]|uniref:Uncharacterized protein n=1 Tax=Sordaria brevicollis TaxID=83679 RepID=A0AAE0P1Q1_SORBR|nr:hypothetical protein B0T20DRAFT_397110 [Sordaria brevicollis]